ncbi:helix-turn-helix domain-containing protein [Ureibacillus thermophilus]|uniref:XRE family transcriptional regulator n=1 Tax=Ureibacillus thermophilus TaxID=367743 RepID=A0A4P6UWZ6_9BACL|nr:helix-turn-helix transcriptional regulator [Ureibacillus thermophilus]QBK26911.1 XRE family transcriptional regulator [Ureibacillus thermophilus]
MDQFEMLKKRARENAFVAKYLDSPESALGKDIIKLRITNRLTQQELAKIAKTTQKTISRIEAGDPGIEIDIYNKVLKKLRNLK